MNPLGILMLALATVFNVACAIQREAGEVTVPVDLGPPIVRNGTIYTPVSVGSHGCLLYNVRIPGGQSPAAQVYQNTEMRFSYDRPEQCVKQTGAQ